MNAQDSNIRDSTIYKIRKNSIYLEILGNGAVYSFNYDRTLPLNNMLAMFLRVGGNEYHGADTNKASLNLIGATGILYGAQKHFFETGIGYTHFCGFPDRLIALTGGYRFQGTKGLIIRVTPMYIYNTEKGDTFGNHFWFGLSLCYSF
jgi:hypothetical protein